MIPQDLIDALVCPACKKPVLLSANGDALKCGVCRRIYPVKDGIPVLLIDSATVEPA